MKTQIRMNVFETNSSSTHSICIADGIELVDFPQTFRFSLGSFGWEHDRLDSIEEKASYLYTGLLCNGLENEFQTIVEILKSHRIEVYVDKPQYNFYDSIDSITGEKITVQYLKYGYVDHEDELGDFLNAIINSEEKLMSYLFSPLSFVLTGNDNSRTDVSINVPYEHFEYYKGN